MSGKQSSLQAKAAQIAKECIAVRLRMLTRAVTKLYNQELRPYGLTVSQMNILVAASHLGLVKQQDICRVLHLDKSTLSRDLALMRMQGWVTFASGDDGRATMLSVTMSGKKVLENAFPAWSRAQEEAKALLGAKEGDSLYRMADAVRARGASGDE